MKKDKMQPDGLAELLERFGVDADSFIALRPDSYEQILRWERDGLALLEQFYSALFGPGTQEEQRLLCPPWPKVSKWRGQHPSTNVLSAIWARIGKDQLLSRVDPIGETLEKFSARLLKTPLGKNEIVLKAVTGILGEQLMEDAVAKRPASLKLVAAIQNQGILEQNEKKLSQGAEKLKQSDRRIKLLEDNAAAAKAKLDSAMTSLKSKGGLTPETLAQIEEAAKLL